MHGLLLAEASPEPVMGRPWFMSGYRMSNASRTRRAWRRAGRQPFKNALCLLMRPEADWPGAQGYEHRCKRLADHAGAHRVKYVDGYACWNTGDRDSVLKEKP